MAKASKKKRGKTKGAKNAKANLELLKQLSKLPEMQKLTRLILEGSTAHAVKDATD